MGNGASEGIRTLDIHVGNVTLYQTELRSRSEERREFSMPEPKCKRRFRLSPAPQDVLFLL